MGQVLERTSLLMRHWDDIPPRRSCSTYAEFALLLLIVLGSLCLGAMGLVDDANAHPGRTASDGCHNDRKNGGRHCHGGPQPSQPTVSPRTGEVYYPNCAAARAAGAAPIYRGQAGYGPHLDRDGDGKACE